MIILGENICTKENGEEQEEAEKQISFLPSLLLCEFLNPSKLSEEYCICLSIPVSLSCWLREIHGKHGLGAKVVLELRTESRWSLQLISCSQRSGRCILKAKTEANSRCISEHANDMGIWA